MSFSLLRSHPAVRGGSRPAGRISLRRRRALATGLRRAVREATSPPRPLSAAVPVQRREVLAARARIERLADDLLTDDVQRRGVELVKELLTRGDSPLYTPSPEGELERAVRHAHAGLLLH